MQIHYFPPRSPGYFSLKNYSQAAEKHQSDQPPGAGDRRVHCNLLSADNIIDAPRQQAPRQGRCQHSQARNPCQAYQAPSIAPSHSRQRERATPCYFIKMCVTTLVWECSVVFCGVVVCIMVSYGVMCCCIFFM